MRTKFILLFFVFVLSFCNPQNENGANVPHNPTEVSPLTIGSSVPSIVLSDPFGNTEDLAALSTENTLIVFYRGGWCPFCSAELSELASIEEELYDRGINIVAISPDQPEYLRETLDEIKTDYLLLSDSNMNAAKTFGIAFREDPETVQNLKENGMDIEKRTGMDHNMLPVPSVFLVNGMGIVEFQYVNPDYKHRIDKDVLLAAVDAMIES